MPRTSDRPEILATMVSENAISIKNSGGPTRSANVASGMARKNSEMLEMKSPMQLEINAMFNALPPLPARASG